MSKTDQQTCSCIEDLRQVHARLRHGFCRAAIELDSHGDGSVVVSDGALERIDTLLRACRMLYRCECDYLGHLLASSENGFADRAILHGAGTIQAKIADVYHEQSKGDATGRLHSYLLLFLAELILQIHAKESAAGLWVHDAPTRPECVLFRSELASVNALLSRNALYLGQDSAVKSNAPTRRRTRHSPLLEEPDEERDLPFAPAPWRLKQCIRTGMIFLSNPPEYAELDQAYAYEHTFAAERQARRRAEPLRHVLSTGLKYLRSHLLRRNKTLDLLREAVASSSSPTINILDVGCGWGSLLEEFLRSLSPALKERCVPYGVEISGELARISDEKLRPLGGQVIHAPALEGITLLQDTRFDAIVMCSYLEHESEPLSILKMCRRRLKAGGSLIVKVPNHDCLNRKLRGKRWCGYRWPDHVNYFTPETLVAMAEKAGLCLRRMRVRDCQPLSDNMYAVFGAL